MGGVERVGTDPDSIQRAALALAQGEIIGFPTETVYGLGAGTFSPRGLEKVYEFKRRPLTNPLISHVLTIDQASSMTIGWDDRCTLLAEAWWPGPLTLVLGRDASVPAQASGGRPTLAIRSPEHPIARELLRVFGEPISAPSANRSGGVSPTRAEHVLKDYADIPSTESLLVVDGGPCRLGIESTVLDMTIDPPRILRPGVLTAEILQPLLGEVRSPDLQEVSMSPGTMSRHYAPQTPCLLVETHAIDAYLSELTPRCVLITTGFRDAPPPHAEIIMPDDPEGYATEIYDAMRRADAERMDLILIEIQGADDPNWAAIRDRLNRAASERS